MRNLKTIFLTGLVLLFAAVCGQTAIAENEAFQVSTFPVFAAGHYDGDFPLGELKKRGDFGIGTVKGLDGEMIALDGKFYQIRSTGAVNILDDIAVTPFALVTFFKGSSRHSLKALPDMASLSKALDGCLATKDLVHGIKITGTFKRVQARSVPIQEKPYKPLSEALKEQVIFPLKDIRGTMVGFRFPESLACVNSPAYHFHFISDDRKSGGHVLDCEVDSCEVSVAELSRCSLELSPLSGGRGARRD